MAITRADTTVRATASFSLVGSLSANQNAASESGSTTKHTNSINFTQTFTDGISTNQADIFWISKAKDVDTTGLTIDIFDFAGGGNLTAQDVGAGTGNDALGVAITIADIVGLAFHNTHATAILSLLGDGGPGTAGDVENWTSLLSGVTDHFIIGPGGGCIIARPDSTGYAVVDASNNRIAIVSDTNNATCDLGIVARDS